jgi:hypothetical protein
MKEKHAGSYPVIVYRVSQLDRSKLDFGTSSLDLTGTAT